ncbi:MAG: DUF378 domain-containing protein [Alphaproteobacteria bacterium]
MKSITFISLILVLIGGLNWGLIGIADFNLVSFLFSPLYLTRVIYILVGISAIWLIIESGMKYRELMK